MITQNVKDDTITFKLTASAKKEIEDYSLKQRMPTGTLIRKMILDKIDLDKINLSGESK